MKTKNVLLSLITSVLMLAAVAVHAQNEADLSAFLGASKQDASNLISAYTAPVVKAVSYGLTSGWYHTAKTHKPLGIDFGVTMNVVFTPSSDNYFQPNFLSNSTTFMNNTNPGSPNAPTIMGPKESTTYTATYDPDGSGPIPTQAVLINGPEGLDMKKNLGFSAVPVPMAQIGIGLIKNTDLKIRFVPQITKGSTNLSMLGFGLMHDVKQYFPGVKLLPFDLSILAGYNSFKGTTSLASTGDPNRPSSTDGKVTYTLNSWIGQILLSKKVAIFTFYGGVGYGAVDTKIKVTGTYMINSVPAGSFPITDPVSISLANKSPKFTVGMRLKFGPIYLNGDYTFQKYNALSLGLGASIR